MPPFALAMGRRHWVRGLAGSRHLEGGLRAVSGSCKVAADLHDWVVVKRNLRTPIYSINWDDEPDLERFRQARATQRIDPRKGLQDLEDLAELGSVAGMCHVGWA